MGQRQGVKAIADALRRPMCLDLSCSKSMTTCNRHSRSIKLGEMQRWALFLKAQVIKGSTTREQLCSVFGDVLRPALASVGKQTREVKPFAHPAQPKNDLFKHLDGKVFECAVAKGKFGLNITSMVLHNGSAGSAASSRAVAGKLDCVATDELALAQAVDSGKEFTLQGLKLRVYKSIVYGAANDDDSDGTSDEDA